MVNVVKIIAMGLESDGQRIMGWIGIEKGQICQLPGCDDDSRTVFFRCRKKVGMK